MPYIARHHVDPDFAREQAALSLQWIDRKLSTLENSNSASALTSAISTIASSASSRLEYLLIGDRGAETVDTWDAALCASQAATAIFDAVGTPGKNTDIVVRQRTYEIPSLGINYSVDASNWLRAVYLAVITGRENSLQNVLSLDSEDVRQPDIGYDSYVFTWIDLVKKYLTHAEIPADLLEKILTRTEPENMEYTSEFDAVRIISPAIELFYQILRRDGQKFNAGLELALELHRSFWERSEHDSNIDPSGFVAKEILFLCILAERVGISVTVESDYLPARLLDGTWLDRG